MKEKWEWGKEKQNKKKNGMNKVYIHNIFLTRVNREVNHSLS
jgi:hypothetical protein